MDERPLSVVLSRLHFDWIHSSLAMVLGKETLVATLLTEKPQVITKLHTLLFSMFLLLRMLYRFRLPRWPNCKLMSFPTVANSYGNPGDSQTACQQLSKPDSCLSFCPAGCPAEPRWATPRHYFHSSDNLSAARRPASLSEELIVLMQRSR